MSWLAFQHYVLEHTVFVFVRFRVSLPVIHNQLAGHGAGLFCLSADIVYFVPFLHIFRKRFTVQEHHRNVRGFGFIDNYACCCAVNRVDQHAVVFFRDEQVNLVILRRLRVLAVYDIYGSNVFGSRVNRVADTGHERVVKFVDGHADLWSFTPGCTGVCTVGGFGSIAFISCIGIIVAAAACQSRTQQSTG
ncbi:hypothetical protein D3C75_852010 [compost metagenome]